MAVISQALLGKLAGAAIGALFGQAAGAAMGALFGGQNQGPQTQTAKREPWEPAQPYILDNLKDAKKLQDFYKKTPFNPQQETSYQNMFGDLDNFRQNMAPGLMGFANSAMSSNYQRQRGGAPGSGGGYGGPVQPAGTLPNGQPKPFSVAPSKSYGLLDFNAQNPYTNGAIKADKPADTAPMDAVQSAYLLQLRQQQEIFDTLAREGLRG
jgi:hypothetical protein